MLDRLSGVLWPSNKYCIRTCGCPERQLINGQTLAASELDSFAGRGREAQGRDGHFRHIEQTNIVGDGSYSYDDFIFACSGRQPRERYWRAINPAGE